MPKRSEELATDDGAGKKFASAASRRLEAITRKGVELQEQTDTDKADDKSDTAMQSDTGEAEPTADAQPAAVKPTDMDHENAAASGGTGVVPTP